VKRLCLIVVGVGCTVAVADAQSISVQSKPARAHAKMASVAGSASRSGGLGGVDFSNPYAPPVGTRKPAIAQFPVIPRDDPIEPQGGMSLTAGRDSPDEPMTGGLKFRF
jgi:hypothetical protein